MRPSSPKPGFSAGNPIANVLVIIAGALVIGASIVLGFFAFLVISAIVLVAAAVVGIRAWWFNRRLQRARGPSGERQPPRSRPQGVIEGEYEVLSRDRDEA